MIRKIEISCRMNHTFRNVRFYPTDRGWAGDVEAIEGNIYIQNIRIPIKASLVGTFFNTFIQEYNSNISELYFEIDSQGNYRVRSESSSNSADFWLGKVLSFGMEKHWSCWYS